MILKFLNILLLLNIFIHAMLIIPNYIIIFICIFFINVSIFLLYVIYFYYLISVSPWDLFNVLFIALFLLVCEVSLWFLLIYYFLFYYYFIILFFLLKFCSIIGMDIIGSSFWFWLFLIINFSSNFNVSFPLFIYIL